MASQDLDPLFVKALRLMHSKSKEAGDQLKQMLDDLIAQRKAQMQSKVPDQRPEVTKLFACSTQLNSCS